MKRTAVILSFLFLLSVFSFAQDDWKTKDVDKWTKEDIKTILEKSDWVKSQEVRLQYSPTQNVAAGSFSPGVVNAGGFSGNSSARAAGNTINQGSIQPAIDFTFTLRLRSSMAIRLALIRQMQLETDVNKLSEAEFAEYKKKQIGLYECPACTDNYVLTLTSSSRENKNYDAVFTALAQARLEELKTYIYLRNDKGEKRELVHFVPPKAPGEEAIFFFRRLDENGNLLFTKDSKHLIFNSTKNEVSTVANFKINITPLIIGEKVDF